MSTADRPSSLMRLAVFASGGGSNFQSILDAIDGGDLAAQVVLLITDRDDAGALDRARAHDVPTRVIDPRRMEEADYSQALRDALREQDVTFIALAGFLKKIPSDVVVAFRHRMLNIHPALLPAFGGRGMYGRRVHQAVIDHGVRWSGATVHLVDEEYDTGPIVLQEPVPVLPGDTAEALAARVLDVEHRLYPAALRLFAQHRVRIEGRTVLIADAATATARP